MSSRRAGPGRNAAAALALSTVLFATSAGATEPMPQASGAPGAPTKPPEVIAEIVPIINTSQVAPSLPWGWTELAVRIQNTSPKPTRGTIRASSQQFPNRRFFTTSAPYSVGAGATAVVRVPAHAIAYADVTVEVADDELGKLMTQRYTSNSQLSVVLFDTSEASRLRGAIHEAYVAPMFIPPGMATPSSGSGTALLVGSPRYDPTTGDPVLPDRAALYNSADAVLMRSDTLSRLTGVELDALAGFVMGGGTLAVVITRPEDLRHPTLAALVGAEVRKTAVNVETLKALSLPTPYSGAAKVIPSVANASDDLSPMLAGYTGGNLRGSLFGASATYGLGEVHLLAFDPTKKPGVDDDWAKGRMVELARRAHDRRSTIVFRPGGVTPNRDLNSVRQVLDPNEGSRWAIAAAALLLCAYAVIAGPLNFSIASKKGKPLSALRWLPIIAAATFAIIVGIGISARGVTGRARHLTLVEAGAGMTKGAARRFRGFFTSKADELTVRTTDSGSIVSTAVMPDTADRRETLVIDRDGARLSEVSALPWQTVVVREDGFASLGEGIAIVREGASDVAVINRSGRRMRAAILWVPGAGSSAAGGTAPGGSIGTADVRYFDRIDDGARVLASAGVDVTATSDGRFWYSQVQVTTRAGSIDLHQLSSHYLRPVLEGDAPGLGDAWRALEDATDATDWFPGDVPVLLAQLDGGEGRTSDAGLRLESDRLLVRIVGFGGKP
ncbi:MAG: hypothetical protein L6Q76_05025 [Polyangiaceae bacterium]|nr:hypothetical protein [Polyangiaceae bacterium]